MLLYLVQHGEATSEEQGKARPLNDKGLSDVRKTAAFLSRLDTGVECIYHSGKLRALQTARVLAETLKPRDGLKETDGLSPLDDPLLWVERIKDMSAAVMLVGHLPHLAKLASVLLFGQSDHNVIAFKMAGIVCLQTMAGKDWTLQWMVIPEICG
ncbi:MAG: phosphohistidine phosphatase SixA [Nitrospirae bacterium]|nr:phosphohistidine phosphatase SixA [Nitrospirota bacterium]